jgi:hypothetical protein
MVGVVAILAQVSGGIGLESLLLVTASLVWLAATMATGNRELFFPFTMHLAACAALVAARQSPRAGWLGGGAVIAAFMVIRVLQQATARVLAVELVVATGILAFALMARPWSRRETGREAAIVVAAALLAYASLAL